MARVRRKNGHRHSIKRIKTTNGKGRRKLQPFLASRPGTYCSDLEAVERAKRLLQTIVLCY